MPNALTVDRVNAAFSVTSIADLAADDALVARMRESGAFLDVAADLLDLGSDDMAYLAAIPPVLQETIRAAIAEAVSRAVGVQVQYSPGYDFEVRVWDFGEAVGVHLTGPYPPGRERPYFGSSSST